MEYKEISKKLKMPVLGLGTWGMGGGFTADRSGDKKYLSAISYAISSGIGHIDTAEIYGHGHTEELVGQAISKFRRKNIFLTTKVSPHHLSYRGVIAACERSLKRLGTDYIDLYLIHWPNPLASMKNAMAAFDELKEDGKIRFVGVSNFSVKQIINAQKYTKNKIAVNQVHFSLLHKNPIYKLLLFCREEKIILTAYSPLEVGGILRSAPDVLSEIAEKYKKTPVQVALRWLLDKPQVVAIPKASSKEHIDEILGALGWHLLPEDSKLLDA